MKRTESEFIFAKFFDAYDESIANRKPTLGLLGVYQLFHDENGHWTLFKQNFGIDCDKHKDDDHAEMLIEAEDIFDMFRTLSEEQFTNHKKFFNKLFSKCKCFHFHLHFKLRFFIKSKSFFFKEKFFHVIKNFIL